MVLGRDAVQIADLALEPAGWVADGGQARQPGIVPGHRDGHLDAIAAEEHVDDPESVRLLMGGHERESLPLVEEACHDPGKIVTGGGEVLGHRSTPNAVAAAPRIGTRARAKKLTAAAETSASATGTVWNRLAGSSITA